MVHSLRLCCLFLLWPCWSLCADLPPGMEWRAASNGAVPNSAVDAGGTGEPRQFICRVRLGAALQTGRLLASGGGCSVGIAGRETRAAVYEVLALRVPNKAAIATVVQPPVGAVQPVIVTLDPGAARGGPPKLDATDSLRRGFASDGRPYVEQTKPDGSVLREYADGTELTDPKGAVTRFPPQSAPVNAQPPTPPELPADPARGRLWLEQHNEALFSVIAALVRNRPSELQVFADSERKAAGTDLFKQVKYRTDIAAFFATRSSRP